MRQRFGDDPRGQILVLDVDALLRRCDRVQVELLDFADLPAVIILGKGSGDSQRHIPKVRV